MSWPSVDELIGMLANPAAAFADADLQACQLERGPEGELRTWQGSSAVVVKANRSEGNEPWALRLFAGPWPHRQAHYEELRKHLGDKTVDCLVHFDYRPEAVRDRHGRRYPLLVMDWAPGERLLPWVAGRLEAGDSEGLLDAARRWQELVESLSVAGIAHGDLEPDNILVSNGGCRLVDYDGMCAGALVGQPAAEPGTPPYQHPGRSKGTPLALHLDHFPALVIYLALRALAVDPPFWTTRGDAPGLLFRTSDFRDPHHSTLWCDLRNSPDEEVRELAEELLRLARGRLEAVPPLRELVPTWGEVQRMVQAGKLSEATEVLSARGGIDAAPAPIRRTLQERLLGKEQQKAYEELCKVPPGVGDEEDARLLRLWHDAEPLFHGFAPALGLRGQVTAARRRLAAVGQVERLLAELPPGGDAAIEREILRAAAEVLSGYRFHADGQQTRLEELRQRAEVFGEFARLLGGSGKESEIAAAWQQVLQSHVENRATPEQRQRAALAVQRVPVLEALARIPQDLPPNVLDRRIREAWRQDLLADCPEAEPWRPLYETALRREKLLAEFTEAFQKRDEEAMLRAVDDPCLANYPLRADGAAEVARIRQRLDRVATLLAALEGDDRDAFRDAFDAGTSPATGSGSSRIARCWSSGPGAWCCPWNGWAWALPRSS